MRAQGKGWVAGDAGISFKTMSDPNPDTLPSAEDPCGPCPRCGRVSNFTFSRGDVLRQVSRAGSSTPLIERADVLTCNGCGDGIVVIAQFHGNAGQVGVLHWYPAPGAGQLDPDVDSKVASCYDEGMRCLGIDANRAASVSFRSALHCFVKDKGTPEAQAERHLKTALKHMKESGRLHPSLAEWAAHVNKISNEGAHPEDYEEVTHAEAKELGDFVRHLIRHEYEMPAQLLRAQNRDRAAIESEATGTSTSVDPPSPI